MDPTLVGPYASIGDSKNDKAQQDAASANKDQSKWGRTTSSSSSTSVADVDAARARMEASAKNDGKGGGGGCIGRACYDRPVVAVAYAKADTDSYKSYRNAEDASKYEKMEMEVERQSVASVPNRKGKIPGLDNNEDENGRLVSGASSGSKQPPLPFWGGRVSSSTQLLSLLPSGIGLAYDDKLKRYVLSATKDFVNTYALQDNFVGNKPLDPEFGPRGRSPVERDRKLGIPAYLRFCASGAICAGGVHLFLTPIDVVKTKLQTAPDVYTGPIMTFNAVAKEGLGAFFAGWVPTFIGFFTWGGVSYTATEFFRRLLTERAGVDAASLEVPIILLSSAIAAFIGSFILAPSETLRIRKVAQPDYADNILDVFTKMVDEEGILSLFSAVPVFLLKEIPFNCAKFTIFDISTEQMFEAFPAAKEDLQLSLLVSLIGGTMGGVIASVVSNPADATISEMKKAKSDMGPVQAATQILDRAGVKGLFKGLTVRMFFYSLLVSLQFFVYDSVRFALGIGTDDLKLYLDVLGGVLNK